VPTLADTYFNHVHPLAFALASAQTRGVLLDESARAELVTKFNQQTIDIRAQIDKIVGREFNPNSPQQVMALLYDEYKLPVIYKRGKGGSVRTADEEALLRLHKRYPDEPVLTKIIEYRKVTKLVSSFLKAKTEEDGAMHTSYNPSGTDTFRISSSKSLWGSGMNLQNIPIGKRPGVENIRHLFIARPGCRFVKGDEVQAEAMVVARILCRYNDYYLWNRYANEPDFDIHKWAASTIFNIPEDVVNDYQRSVGKIANHAGNYCAGPKVVQSTATKWGVEGVDYNMAKKIAESRRGALKGLQKWWQDVEMTIRRSRTLTTCMGRRRQFFGRFDDNATIRAAVAFEPQSVVGDVCNRIFWLLYQEFQQNVPAQFADKQDQFAVILQVHDEVVAECPVEAVGWVKDRMNKAAWQPLYLNDDMDPLVIPIEITSGPNWRDCV
jgi:DNA polymerase-1